MAKTRTVQTSVMTTEMVTLESDSLESDSLDFKTLVSVFARLQSGWRSTSGWRLKRADIVFEKKEISYPMLVAPKKSVRRR